MAKNSKNAGQPKLYLMEIEYDRRGNGLWHSLKLIDSGNAKAIRQSEQLDVERRLASKWKPLEVAVERSKKMGDLVCTDGGIGNFAASQKAIQVLRPLLGTGAEFLPLTIVGECEDFGEPERGKFSERYPRMAALHCLSYVDLAPNAEATYFEGTHAIVIAEVVRYAFHPEDIQDKHLFKVRGDSAYLASQSFRQAVMDAGLKGVVFQPVKYDLGRKVEVKASRPKAKKPSVKVDPPSPINFSNLDSHPVISRQLWDSWVEHWQWITKAIKARGGEAHSPKIGPPTSKKKIDQLQRSLGTPLPKDFVEVITGYSSKVTMDWDLCSDVGLMNGLASFRKHRLEKEDRPPKPYQETSSCGGAPLWDVSVLLSLKRAHQKLLSSFPTPLPDYQQAYVGKLPFIEAPNGDWIAFDISQGAANCPVCYLSHDGDVSIHNRRLGENFVEFMTSWTSVGCPGPEFWQIEPFYDKRGRRLKASGPAVDHWKRWVSEGRR